MRTRLKFTSNTASDDHIKVRSYKCSNIFERNLQKCDKTTIWTAICQFQKSKSRVQTTRSEALLSSYRHSSAMLGWPSSFYFSPVSNSSSHLAASNKCLQLSRIFTKLSKKTKFSGEFSHSSLERWFRIPYFNLVHLKFT